MQLLACGSNARGQLGTNDTVDKNVFTPCYFHYLTPSFPPTITSIVSAVFGANHTVLVCENANVIPPLRHIWGSGDGTSGQLGAGIHTQVRRFRKLEIPDRAPRKQYANEGDIVHIGACWATTYIVYRPDPIKLSRNSTQSDVFVSFGADSFGELGARPSAAATASFANAILATGLIPSSTPPVFRIERLATGPHHVIVILHFPLIDGSIREIIVGWGASRHGQLELHEHVEIGATQTASSASLIPTDRPARRSNGTTGYISTPTHLYTVPEDEKVVSIALGHQHSVILIQAKDGSTKVCCGGSNRKAQLRFSSEITNIPLRSVDCTWNGTYFETGSKPTDSGEAVFSILATGSDKMGQLGRGVSRAIVPVPSATASPNIPVASTSTSASLLDGDHRVLFPPSVRNARLDSFACGSEHVVATLCHERGDLAAIDNIEREAWGWGWNEHGNLGLGHVEDVPAPTRVWPPPTNTNTNSQVLEGRLKKAWAGNGTTLLLIE